MEEHAVEELGRDRVGALPVGQSRTLPQRQVHRHLLMADPVDLLEQVAMNFSIASLYKFLIKKPLCECLLELQLDFVYFLLQICKIRYLDGHKRVVSHRRGVVMTPPGLLEPRLMRDHSAPCFYRNKK